MLRLILTSRVYDVARETPLDPAPRLSRRLGNDVLLKREDLQPVFSFKLRGAYNKIAHLTRRRARARRHRGERRQPRAGRRVLGAAARAARGHRHAADDAARSRWMRCGDWAPRSCWPATATPTRKAHCDELVAETGMTFIHPFDDPLVIAGQGTIGDGDPAPQLSDDSSAVFVPVGGGGLIAGIAGYIKALRPDVKVIGVEPFEADAMYQSLAAGRRVALDHVGIFADGVAVREVGEQTFPIVQRRVDEIVRVDQRRDLRGDQGRLRRHAHRSWSRPARWRSPGCKPWVERERRTRRSGSSRC